MAQPISSNFEIVTTGTPAARTLANRFVAPVNVMDFGAIANGTAHAASTVYGSLAALQAVYGTTITIDGTSFTVALTQELDWLAAISAHQSAAAAGGTVYYPPGTYIFSNSNSVSDGSGTLIIPESAPYWVASTGSPGVDMVGAGMNATFLRWPSDLGTGKFAILCQNRATTTIGYSGVCQDFTMAGPVAATSITLGTAPCNMNGIGHGAKRNLDSLIIDGFRSPLCVSGDQCEIKLVHTATAYYGCYFDITNSSMFGDIHFQKCIFDVNALAGIGISNSASIKQCTFETTYVGGAPVGIFKETGGSDNVIISGCHGELQIENIGNAGITDALTPTTRVGTISDCFIKFEFLWNAANTWSGMNSGVRTAFLDVGACSDTEWTCILPSNLKPGSEGVFNILSCNGVRLKTNIMNIITLCGSASGTDIGAILSPNTTGQTTFELDCIGVWKGVMAYGFNAATPQTNSFVMSGSLASGVYKTAGNTGDYPAGILMHAGAFWNGVSGSQWCAIANWGFVQVNTSGTVAAPSSGSPTVLRTGASGVAVQDTSFAETTSKIIGVAEENVSTNVWMIHLRGLA